MYKELEILFDYFFKSPHIGETKLLKLGIRKILMKKIFSRLKHFILLNYKPELWICFFIIKLLTLSLEDFIVF